MRASWPLLVTHTLASIPDLTTRIREHSIDVDVPSGFASHSLGLFLHGAPTSSLSCTINSVAWQCVNATMQTYTFPQPEWRASYIVMLLSGSCLARAASKVFKAGPTLNTSMPRIEVSGQRPAATTTQWRTCAELHSYQCPEIHVQVHGRGTSAHEADTVALLPIYAASVNGKWLDLVQAYSRASASADNILGSTHPNASLRLAMPLRRALYVAVLLGRLASNVWSSAVPLAVSEVFESGAINVVDTSFTIPHD